MRRNDNELTRVANGLTFEPHRIRFDRTGRYEEPLDREFPFIIKLFRFKHREITPGLTWHERLELFVPLDGVVRMRMGDRVAEVGKGEILIVDNLKLHATVDYPGFNTRVVVISFLAEFVYSLGSPSHDYFLLLPFYAPAARRSRVVETGAVRLPQIHGAIGRLVTCYFDKDSCYQIGCKAFLLELLYYLAQEFQVTDFLHSELVRQQERAARLRPVFDFVAHHYSESISLPEAASLAKMSQPQFTKLFPKVAGMTFVSYVTHVRLSHAVRLLKETALTVAEVAGEVGFTDSELFRSKISRRLGSLPQSVVCALFQGPEKHYSIGEKLAGAMFAPILRLHRVTVEQMAILEPAVVESTMLTCITVLREAMERAVELGVPEEAAKDFCLGHIRTLLAIVFGFAGFPVSDGAKRAATVNHPRIFRENWKDVISIPAVKESVQDICATEVASR